MNRRRLTKDEFLSEFMAISWRTITPQTLDSEIKASMIRNEIENLIYRVKFLHPLNDDYLKRYTDYGFYEKNEYDIKTDKAFMKQLLIYLEGTN